MTELSEKNICEITYEHRCGCSRQGQRFVVRAVTRDGVALAVVAPTCLESLAGLVEVSRVTR